MLRSVALLILLHFVQLSGAQDVGHDSGTRPTSVEQQPEVRPSEVGATESEDDDGYAELAAIYAEPESETRPVSVEQQLDEDTPPVPPTLPPTYLEKNFPPVKGPENCRNHSGNEDACETSQCFYCCSNDICYRGAKNAILSGCDRFMVGAKCHKGEVEEGYNCTKHYGNENQCLFGPNGNPTGCVFCCSLPMCYHDVTSAELHGCTRFTSDMTCAAEKEVEYRIMGKRMHQHHDEDHGPLMSETVSILLVSILGAIGVALLVSTLIFLANKYYKKKAPNEEEGFLLDENFHQQSKRPGLVRKYPWAFHGKEEQARSGTAYLTR